MASKRAKVDDCKCEDPASAVDAVSPLAANLRCDQAAVKAVDDVSKEDVVKAWEPNVEIQPVAADRKDGNCQESNREKLNNEDSITSDTSESSRLQHAPGSGEKPARQDKQAAQ